MPDSSLPSLDLVDGLAQTSFVVQGLLERHASAHGLSMVQTRLLAILRDRRPTMNELARLLGLDKSSTSGLVDRATRRGLVTRQPSPNDRRSVLVALTDDGRGLVNEVAAQFADEVAELVTPLSAADRTRLSKLLGALLAGHAAAHGIDPDSADPPR